MTPTAAHDIVAGIDAEHPWPGLMPFSEEAQAFFHGRDAETQELLRLIRREMLTVLFGQSGLGKSSLLNAGLFPRLREADFLPVYIRLDLGDAATDLTTQILERIAGECREHRIDGPATLPGDSLWTFFHRRDADFWSVRNRLVTPVLVFDQFEEIFTLGRHGEAVAARCRTLIGELADLIENRLPDSLAHEIEQYPERGQDFDFSRQGCKVVFSFREDYLPDFEGLRQQIRPIMQNRMRLTRMSGDKACAAILDAGGALVGTEVAEQIVRFVSAPQRGRGADELARLEVEPALMSVVCRELNNRRLRAGRPRIEVELLGEGAQEKIIEDFYHDSLADLDPRVRSFVEDQLLTDAGFRDSCALDDAQAFPGVTRDAIDTLIGRRLLRVEERAGVLRVELTHDVLTSVARRSRDQRKEEAEEEARREVEARRRRRARRLMAVSGVALSLAVGIAVVFGILLKKADVERQHLIETQSDVWLSRAAAAAEQGTAGDPYAMIAQSLRLNPANRAAQYRAVALLTQRRHAVQTAQADLAGVPQLAGLDAEHCVLHGAGTVALCRWNETGTAQQLAVRSSGTEFEDAGLLSLELLPPAPPLSLNFSSSAPEIAAGDGRKLRRPFAYHPEAKVVSYVSAQAMLHLFDIASRRELAAPLQLPGIAQEVIVSKDRRWIAAATENGRMLLASTDGKSATRLPGVTPPEKFPALVGVTDDGILVRRSGQHIEIVRVERNGQAGITAFSDAAGPAAISIDGQRLAYAAAGAVRIVDLRSGQVLDRQLIHPAAIRDLAFSADGRRLATASVDKLARLWDTARLEPVGNPLRHQGVVLNVRFSPDGMTLATGAADGTARLWNAENGRLLIEPMMHPDPIAGIGMNGDTILAATFGNALVAWQRPAAAPPGQSSVARETSPRTAGDAIRAVTSRSGKWRITTDAAEVVRIFDAGNGNVVTFVQHKAEVLSAELSPDDTLLMTLDARGLYLWDARSGWGVAEIPLTRRPVRASFSADGNAIHLVLATGLERHMLVKGKDGRKTLDKGGIARDTLAFGDLRPMTAEFSPSGRRLALGGADGRLRLVGLDDLQFSGETMRHEDAVVGVAFTPDEERLLSWSADRSLRVWDARSGHAAADAIEAPDDPFSMLATMADNGDIAVTTKTGKVRYAVGRPPAGPAPAWLPEMLEAAGGIRIDPLGGSERLRDRLQQLDSWNRSAPGDVASEWRRLFDGIVRSAASQTSPRER